MDEKELKNILSSIPFSKDNMLAILGWVTGMAIALGYTPEDVVHVVRSITSGNSNKAKGKEKCLH